MPDLILDPLPLCEVDDVLMHPALTGERVAKAEDANLTAFIARAIAAFSTFAERYCDRVFRAQAWTEILDVAPRSALVALRAYPVTDIQEVRESPTQDFENVDPMETTHYALCQNGRTGLVRFVTCLYGGPQSLQIIYSGGIATELNAVPGDLRFAAATHVAYTVRRAPTLHLKAQGMMQSSATMFSEGSLLPEVKGILDSYARSAW